MTAISDITEAYERDGVVRVRGLFSAEEVTEIRNTLERYVETQLSSLPKGDYTLEADGKTVRNLWRIEQHEPRLVELANQPRLRDLVAALVHGEPVLAAIETFNKQARVGSGVPHHQDNAYFCQSPPDMLTVWIAIDPATEENGPVYYIKGSHRGGMLPSRKSGVAGNSMGLAEIPDTPLEEQFCGTLAPGDALIHHCQTIHHSAPNRSEQSRLGLLLVYRGAHTQRDPALHAFYTA
jgi:ectoine hydroxylase-related dioxygenase (phytanoyl-CoA dioxygenase family)